MCGIKCMFLIYGYMCQSFRWKLRARFSPETSQGHHSTPRKGQHLGFPFLRDVSLHRGVLNQRWTSLLRKAKFQQEWTIQFLQAPNLPQTRFVSFFGYKMVPVAGFVCSVPACSCKGSGHSRQNVQWLWCDLIWCDVRCLCIIRPLDRQASNKKWEGD